MSATAKRDIPAFSTDQDEIDFWAEHDVVDFFDWTRSVEGSFPMLKPSTTAISIRLPAAMLEDLKALANEQGVPYQSLLKMFLAERIARERQQRKAARS
jgi:predicted DNA binding CopG/RHH family protein